MAKTYSTMLPLGTEAPSFSLQNVDGNTISLSDFKDSKAYLVMFICNHCPFVIHVRDALVQMANDFEVLGVKVLAINSNDPEEYPEDSPVKMKEHAQKYKFTFPYLFDESQNVAKAYQAACTPDFFLFDHKKELVYRGQMDESRPGNSVTPNGKDLRNAVSNLLAGKPVPTDQKPSIGCNIKWRTANTTL